ncbi:MAG: YigZ family protein [Ignavibacteria bacterium]|nr:YigZ family protein [Ignavibacteria bacterium]
MAEQTEIFSYRTLASPAEYEHRESKSRFIALAFHAGSAEEAIERYASVKKLYHDAAHFPYAYRVNPSGSVSKSSDDGEPSGTGGKPLADALQKHSLTNSVITVVRYFGGVKLGVGGLRRAFFTAADECLASANFVEVHVSETYLLVFSYPYMSAVMKAIEDLGIKIIENRSAEHCTFLAEVRKSCLGEFRERLMSATNGSAEFRPVSV